MIKLFLLNFIFVLLFAEKVNGLDFQNIVNVACGEHHSVAVNEWGQIFSWGSNSHGQLGNRNLFIFMASYSKIGTIGNDLPQYSLRSTSSSLNSGNVTNMGSFDEGKKKLN